MTLKPPDPIYTVDLFPPLRAELLMVLRSLSADEWQRPTVCAGWNVKDIAQHLLADDMGFLSRNRDNYRLDADVDSWESLVAFINDLNDVWVRATRRLSPRLLCDLLAITGDYVHDYLTTLDPHAKSGPVGWAGPDPAPVWLQIAREYTEHWLHHQHIHEAVGRPGLTAPHFFKPLIGTFVYGVPNAYRTVAAPDSTQITLVIPGDSGGTWHITRQNGRWGLYAESDLTPACAVTLDADTAWRLFTRGISKAEALPRVHFEGDRALGEVVLDTVSILA